VRRRRRLPTSSSRLIFPTSTSPWRGR
jgi:hypothetical protein